MSSPSKSRKRSPTRKSRSPTKGRARKSRSPPLSLSEIQDLSKSKAITQYTKTAKQNLKLLVKLAKISANLGNKDLPLPDGRVLDRKLLEEVQDSLNYRLDRLADYVKARRKQKEGDRTKGFDAPVKVNKALVDFFDSNVEDLGREYKTLVKDAVSSRRGVQYLLNAIILANDARDKNVTDFTKLADGDKLVKAANKLKELKLRSDAVAFTDMAKLLSALLVPKKDIDVEEHKRLVRKFGQDVLIETEKSKAFLEDVKESKGK